MNPKAHILKVEKQLFQEHKKIINDATVVADKNFKTYWRHYSTSVKSYKKTTDLKTLVNKMQTSNVVLIGDYHTLDQSQRSFVRLLRYFLQNKNGKNAVVALETLEARHQKFLDAYLPGILSTDQFIKKIGFKKHWFFDLWSNYAVIFDFIKYHKVPAYAIDGDHRRPLTLKERDVFMAERILEILKSNPEKTVFVLVGDLHLAPRHLPLELKTLAKKKHVTAPKILTLYQNSPEIYWKLASKGLAHDTDFVQIRENEFCRMHTPPLIVQQSYLNWLYHEEGTFDWVDAKANFLHIVEQICKILDLKIPKDYENIEVYTCGDLSFLPTLKRKKLFTPSELKFMNAQIRSEQSCFFPRARVAYIANVSIHHAAEEASHYIKFLFSGEEFARNRQDAFYANILHEALGFFGSKLINAKRKCPRYSDFVQDKKFLEKSGLDKMRALEYETATLFLEHWHKINREGTLFHGNRVANMSSKLFLSLTHAIGYDLGDHLYFGFMNGAIDKREFQALFRDPFAENGRTGTIYSNLFNRLKAVKRPRYH